MTPEEQFKEKIHEIFKKREVPQELLRATSHVYWLHEYEYLDIEDVVRYIWAYSTIYNYKLNRDKFDYMINEVHVALLNPLERNSQSHIPKEEFQLRHKVIEMLINLTCDVYMDNPTFYVVPLSTEKILERLEEYQQEGHKYAVLFTHKDKADVYFEHFMEQYMKGVPIDDIEVDNDEVEKDYQTNFNKIRDKDKRVRYRDIEMIDVDTKEVVKTFKDRAECLDETGISKSNLSQCITSAKVQKNSIYKYNGWRSWKDKSTGKRYFFHEKYKTE